MKPERLSADYVGYSVSWGTLKPDDLAQAFIHFLRSVRDEVDLHGLDLDEADEALAQALEAEDWEYADHILWEWLGNTLDSIAPEGCYFGAHPGDGSDFGFWYEDEWEDSDESDSGEDA